MTLLLVISIIVSGCNGKLKKEEIESIQQAVGEINFSVNEETPKTVADQISENGREETRLRIETDQGVVEIIGLESADPRDYLEPEDLPIDQEEDPLLTEEGSMNPTEETMQGSEADDDLQQAPDASKEPEKASSEESQTPAQTPSPESAQEEKPAAPSSSDPMNRVIDFASLQSKKNADIYAWISVPGTNVDYPVLQHPSDNGYYLYHNLNGSQGYPGCIYTENYNSKDWSDPVTVLYGHDMRSTGTMFHQLHKFEKQSFFDKNQYFYIYTPEKTMQYHIFAAYVNTNEHLLGSHNFSNKTEFDTFFGTVLGTNNSVSHARDDVAIDSNSKIVALSTCIKNQPNNRYIIFGVLVE